MPRWFTAPLSVLVISLTTGFAPHADAGRAGDDGRAAPRVTRVTHGLEVARDVPPVVLGRGLYFAADDGSSGTELWRTDIRSGRTRMVADVRRGRRGSQPDDLTAVHGVLYFTAATRSRGRELFRVSGSAPRGPVKLVEDINPMSGAGSAPEQLTVLGGTLYYSADDGTHGRELWSTTTGRKGATSMVADVYDDGRYAGGDPRDLTELGKTLYFTADDGSRGRRLWRTTADGAEPVGSSTPSADGSDPRSVTAVGDLLFFSASGDGSPDTELWQFDPATDAVTEVADINPGPYESDPSQLIELGGVLFFTADDRAGVELWRHDPATGVTAKVSNLRPDGGSQPKNLTVVGSRLFFTILDGTGLWSTDADGDQPVQVGQLGGPDGPSFARDLTAAGHVVYLVAEDDESGAELWRVDPRASGDRVVRQVADIGPGSAGGDPAGILVTGRSVFFSAVDATERALWRVERR